MDDLAGKFCRKPFDFFEVDSNGKAWLCCEDWLPTSIGNLKTDEFEDVWNSCTAIDIRKSILDGSYKYCNRNTCPSIIEGTLEDKEDITDIDLKRIVANQEAKLRNGPITLNFSHDNTCNLKCPTCRPEIIALKGRRLEEAQRVHDVVVNQALKSARTVIITGQGDAFASRIYRTFLQEFDVMKFPNVKFTLLTNGLLLTPDMWASIENIHGQIHGISVSIDAASELTYSINRGGRFSKLMENLQFLKNVRKDVPFQFLEISFVVQENNFHEMTDFVELGEKINCTSILFQKLIHWPSVMSYHEYLQRAVHLPSHPQHQRFMEMINSDILKTKTVSLSNLSNLVE